MKKEIERFTVLLVHATTEARLYRHAETGAEMWIPRSVLPSVQKSPKPVNGLEQHFVEVEKWWLKKHPWPKTAERQLL